MPFFKALSNKKIFLRDVKFRRISNICSGKTFHFQNRVTFVGPRYRKVESKYRLIFQKYTDDITEFTR